MPVTQFRGQSDIIEEGSTIKYSAKILDVDNVRIPKVNIATATLSIKLADGTVINNWDEIDIMDKITDNLTDTVVTVELTAADAPVLGATLVYNDIELHIMDFVYVYNTTLTLRQTVETLIRKVAP
jgi:hypothetical protein